MSSGLSGVDGAKGSRGKTLIIKALQIHLLKYYFDVHKNVKVVITELKNVKLKTKLFLLFLNI